ncbi:YdcF family protein [Thermovibrio sp.]
MIFLIKKVIGNFVVLPGLFILIAALLFFLLLKNRLRAAKLLSFLLLFLIYLFSTEPGRNLLLKPLEGKYPYPELEKVNCSYVVVLGGGVVSRSPSEGGLPAVRGATLERLYEAFKVWKVKRIPIVVSGGRVTSAFSEASAMKRVLVNLGVPPSQVIEEDRSRTTFENALYTKKLIGSRPICLITSAYHMPRSVRMFEAFGFKVVPVPADYRVGDEGYDLFSFLPFPHYIQDSVAGYREWVGIIFFEVFSKWRAREDSNLRPTD